MPTLEAIVHRGRNQPSGNRYIQVTLHVAFHPLDRLQKKVNELQVAVKRLLSTSQSSHRS